MKLIDLTGQKFGSLTVIKRSRRKTLWGGTYWICKCDCGKTLYVRSDNLRERGSSQCSECRGRYGFESAYVKEGEE